MIFGYPSLCGYFFVVKMKQTNPQTFECVGSCDWLKYLAPFLLRAVSLALVFPRLLHSSFDWFFGLWLAPCPSSLYWAIPIVFPINSLHPYFFQQHNAKIQQIRDIWAAGLGVVSLHIFQSVIPVEAYTREACMIDALGKMIIYAIQFGNNWIKPEWKG